jgi:hypothetical protein
MHRSRVHFWRRRFSASGIRGLWDAEGALPREPIPEEVEREIVSDCLYRPRMSGVFARERIMGGSLTWNVRSLALRYGVSQATVQRVWKKYGIKMVRYYRLDRGVDLRRLKISQDPLFGVTVYEIAGLFYETVGPVLALCSRERPFSELALSQLSQEARQEIAEELAMLIRNLEERNMKVLMKNAGLPNFRLPSFGSEQFLEFLRMIVANPWNAGAQVHLLVDSWEGGAWASVAARAYLTERPYIRLQVAPRVTPRTDWGNWVTCWLRAIAAWPLQTSFIERAFQIRELLRLDRGHLGPRVIIS